MHFAMPSAAQLAFLPDVQLAVSSAGTRHGRSGRGLLQQASSNRHPAIVDRAWGRAGDERVGRATHTHGDRTAQLSWVALVLRKSARPQLIQG